MPKTKLSKPKVNNWISRKEAITMLQCGKIKYYELVNFGQIKAITFQNRVLVERASVEKFIATHDLKYNKRRYQYFKKEVLNDG